MDTAPTRADAERRAARIRAFRRELEALIAAGAVSLSAEQRQAIASYHDHLLERWAADYDIDRSDAAERLSLGMRIAAFVAAVAIVGALYSFVARFWARFDLPLQVTLLCAFPLVALVGVELSARRERSRYVASICALVAYAGYWLAVVVVGDLLNLPLTPFALWGGALFGVALALPYALRLVYGLSLCALVAALAGSIFQAAGMPWTQAAEFPEIATVAALLLAAATSQLAAFAPGFAAVTRGVAFAIGFLGLLMLSTSGPASLLPLPAWAATLAYQFVIVVVAVTTLVVAIRRQWMESVYLAAASLTVFLLLRMVDWFWAAVPRFVFFLLLAAAASAWLFALGRIRQRLRGGTA